MYVEGQYKDGDAVTRNTPVLVGGVDGSGNAQTLLVGTDGGLKAVIETPALGQATMANSLPVAIASNQSPVQVNLAASASATGLSTYSTIDGQPGGSANASGVVVKNTAGKVHGYDLFNLASSVRYVKLYNASAVVDEASATPVRVLAIPANSGLVRTSVTGISFSIGIVIRCVTGVGNTDNTAPTANDVIVNLDYV